MFACLLYELLQMLFKNNQLDVDFLLYYSFYFRLLKNISYSITKKQKKIQLKLHIRGFTAISYLISKRRER